MMTDLTQDFELQLDEVAKSIKIPPCPALLSAFQAEMAKDDPDPKNIVAIVRRDVAMSATLLKSANSAYFNLRRKASSVEDALSLLGFRQCGAIMMGLIARKAIQAEGPMLTRFWDVSDKRAMAMGYLAKKLRVGSQEVAHTFGLFCDIGIPLLMDRFENYDTTLQQANDSTESRFTAVEDSIHNTNHATIGALLGRTWNLPQDVVLAIRMHHDYEVISDVLTPNSIKYLVALSVVVERIIQTYHHKNHHHEWEKGGPAALDALGINDHEMEDLCEELHAMFDATNNQ